MGMSFNNGDSGSSIRTKLNAVLAQFETDGAFDHAVTWNDVGTTFTALKTNVTDTASAAGSLLMDLQVGGISQFSVAKVGDATLAGGVYFNKTGTGPYLWNTANSPLRFATNNSEAVRITGSGDVLVGKTTASSAIEGAQLNANGTVIGTVDGNRPLILNRLTSDGDIAEFRKDSSAVGSIGTRAGYITIGDNGAGLLFNGTQTRIQPEDGGGATDNEIDLGSPSTQFKDIHMAGTLYLGGLEWLTGSGSPEGVVTAPVGSMYTRSDGGTSTTLYVKESGTGNTGWVAK